MSDNLPRPKSRMWSTRFRWHRPLAFLASPIEVKSLLTDLPAPDDVSPYGEYLLLEDHTYVLHRDGTQSVRIHTLNMPWSNAALSQWDQLQRWFHVRGSRTTFRNTRLYLPDGTSRKQKVHKHSDPAGNTSLHLEYRPLRPGVIVELEELTDHFRPGVVGPAMWGHFLLRTGPPCRRRRLTLAVADPYRLTVQTHNGAPSPTVSKNRDYEVFQWDLHNVDGLSADLLPYGRDFLPWVDFSTVPDWRAIHAHLEKELSPRTRKNRREAAPFRELLDELITKEQSPREKLTAIHRHVASKIRYGRSASEWNNRQVRDSHDVLDELRGDCKDKSALLVQLLEHIEIPAKIAVLMTAEDGRIPYLPSLRFNHAIVRANLEGEDIWIDPAAGPFRLGDVPRNVQGLQTLLLSDDGPEVVISPRAKARNHSIRRRYVGQLTAEGDYLAEVTTELSGQPSAEWRSVLLDASPEERRRFVHRQITALIPGVDIEDWQILTLEDLGLPLKLTYRIHWRGWARRIRRIGIAQFPWDSPLSMSGVLAESSRQHPLPSLDPAEIDERHEITLPPNVRSYGLPYLHEVTTPWLKYRNRLRAAGNRIVAHRQLQFRAGLVQPDEFPSFRANCEGCAQADLREVIFIENQQPH